MTRYVSNVPGIAKTARCTINRFDSSVPGAHILLRVVRSVRLLPWQQSRSLIQL